MAPAEGGGDVERDAGGRAGIAGIAGAIAGIPAVVVGAAVVAAVVAGVVGLVVDSPMAPAPGEPLMIDTRTCALEDVEVVAPAAVVAGERFDVRLEPVPADDPRRGPCPARVALRPFGGGEVELDDVVHELDLLTADLSFPVVAGEEGEVRVLVVVESLDPCVRHCLSPWDRMVEVAVTADPEEAAVGARLGEILDAVEVDVEQEHAIAPGGSERVDVVVRCAGCGPVPDGGLVLRATSPAETGLDLALEEVVAGPQVDVSFRTTVLARRDGEGDAEVAVWVTVENRIGDPLGPPARQVFVPLEGTSPSTIEELDARLGPWSGVAASIGGLLFFLGGVLAVSARARTLLGRRLRAVRERFRGPPPGSDSPFAP
jgi:hypothetical protein